VSIYEQEEYCQRHKLPLKERLEMRAHFGGISALVGVVAAGATITASVAGAAALSAVAYAGAGMAIAGGLAGKGANDNAAAVAQATAQYNANVDVSQAKQKDLNTLQQIDNERSQNKTYMSQIETSYTGAGVLNTGSALDVEATAAGRLEQNIQQEYVTSLSEQELLYASADIGIAEGQAQADYYKEMGDMALFNGISNALGFIGKGIAGMGSPSTAPAASQFGQVGD